MDRGTDRRIGVLSSIRNSMLIKKRYTIFVLWSLLRTKWIHPPVPGGGGHKNQVIQWRRNLYLKTIKNRNKWMKWNVLTLLNEINKTFRNFQLSRNMSFAEWLGTITQDPHFHANLWKRDFLVNHGWSFR